MEIAPKIKYLEVLTKNSNNQCWVIQFDGVIIPGAKHRAFETQGRAKSSFAQLINSTDSHVGLSAKEIRIQLESQGRLKFINLTNQE